MTETDERLRKGALALLAAHGMSDGFNLPALPGYVVTVDPEAVIAAVAAALAKQPDDTVCEYSSVGRHDYRCSKCGAALTSPAMSPTNGLREQMRAEIINTPETADFMAGVPIEAAHQRERWGAEHDTGKSPFDWFWLIGYLAQKAADAQTRGDLEKAKHHTISTAAALANWHANLTGADTSMRPGIDPAERNAA